MRELDETQGTFAPSVCYPVDHLHALDVLRPSALARVTARSEGSQFLHLWNQLLTHAGVRKTHPPPRGSLLRDLVERHQIGGWDGEYDEAELSAAVERYRRFLARTAATSAPNVGP
jgi:hypothetical protein